jgi:hypothetical protein
MTQAGLVPLGCILLILGDDWPIITGRLSINSRDRCVCIWNGLLNLSRVFLVKDVGDMVTDIERIRPTEIVNQI